jgi:transposase-like protein
MKRLPRAIYTKEFRDEAVKLVLSDGLSASEAARRLSISIKTLSNWLRAAHEGKLAEVGQNQAHPADMEMELARAKRELAEVRMERDLLKSLRPTSQNSRSEVRQFRPDATCLAGASHVPAAGGVGGRLLCLAQPHTLYQNTAATQAASGMQIGVHDMKRVRKEPGLHCRQKRNFKATA